METCRGTAKHDLPQAAGGGGKRPCPCRAPAAGTTRWMDHHAKADPGVPMGSEFPLRVIVARAPRYARHLSYNIRAPKRVIVGVGSS